MKSQQRLRWLSAVAAVSPWRSAPASRRAEDATQRVHGARDRSDQGVRRRRSTRLIPTSSSSGCAIRPASSRRSCSPRRRIRRPTSSWDVAAPAWRCSPTKACWSRTRRRASTRSRPQLSRLARIRRLGRHGRVGRGDVLQHRRGAEAEPAEARDVEGPDEARVQGQDRHAESGIVGHRLPRRQRLDPDVGRGRGLEVHGRAAREHRAVYTHSGSQPCTQAGAGEFPIGISFEYRAIATKKHRRADRHRSSRTKDSAGTSRRAGS